MRVAIVWIAVENGVFIQKETKVFSDPKDLKDYWQYIKLDHNAHPDIEFHYYTVHRTKATPMPSGKKEKQRIKNYVRRNRDLLWCSYCRAVRAFVKPDNRDVEECTICDVSINEYYIKKFNSLGE